MSEYFAQLRKILNDGCFSFTWKELVALFDSWPDDGTLDVAIRYALPHLDNNAPDNYRTLPKQWYERNNPCQILTRCLNKELIETNEQLDKISQEEPASYITCLNFSSTTVNNFDPLKRFKILQELCFAFSDFGYDNMEQLRGLTSLRNLNFSESAIDYLDPLYGLELESLDLCSTEVNDLSPLSGMTSLRHLGLYDNFDLTTLEHIRGLRNLTSLTLGKTGVRDFSPIADLESLEQLYFCEIVDLGLLVGLKNLKLLYMVRGPYPQELLDKEQEGELEIVRPY